MVLFANYKTYAVAVDKDGKKFKAQGGERVMYTHITLAGMLKIVTDFRLKCLLSIVA